MIRAGEPPRRGWGLWTGLCQASLYGWFQAGCWSLVTGESRLCRRQASSVVGEGACGKWRAPQEDGVSPQRRPAGYAEDRRSGGSSLGLNAAAAAAVASRAETSGGRRNTGRFWSSAPNTHAVPSASTLGAPRLLPASLAGRGLPIPPVPGWGTISRTQRVGVDWPFHSAALHLRSHLGARGPPEELGGAAPWGRSPETEGR